jgi:hypothetical protein
MHSIIYILTVLYFSYVIYVVQGNEIGTFVKKNFPNGLSLLSK